MFIKELHNPSLKNEFCILDQFVEIVISTWTIIKRFPELLLMLAIRLEQSFTKLWKFTLKTWPDMPPFQWYAGTSSPVFPAFFVPASSLLVQGIDLAQK